MYRICFTLQNNLWDGGDTYMGGSIRDRRLPLCWYLLSLGDGSMKALNTILLLYMLGMFHNKN